MGVDHAEYAENHIQQSCCVVWRSGVAFNPGTLVR